MATISTHNGTEYSPRHNRRDRSLTDKEKHIDAHGIHENWIDVDARAAYAKIFGSALNDYNAKQKRDDRKIRDYYSRVQRDKKLNPVYEMVVAVGNKNERIDDRTGKAILREFVAQWSERNPNLEIIGAYYHADERGVPHVHVDYIPVAHGYKTGMETRTGLVRALGEQGFKKQGRETAQITWQRRENMALENICRSYGITVEHPQAGKDVKHLATPDYQLAQTFGSLSKLSAKRDKVADDVGKLSDQADELAKEIAYANAYLTEAERVQVARTARERAEDGKQERSR